MNTENKGSGGFSPNLLDESSFYEDKSRYDDGFEGDVSIIQTSESKLKGNVFAVISFFTALISIFTIDFTWFGFMYPCISIILAWLARKNNSSYKFLLLLSVITATAVIIMCFCNIWVLYPQVEECMHRYILSYTQGSF